MIYMMLIYTYNADGVRTSKTVNGETTRYITDGTKLLEEKYADGKRMSFFYDASGNVLGFDYYESGSDSEPDTYYYKKNVQGDVTGIVDSTGEVIARYEYDAWGYFECVYDGTGEGLIYDIDHIAYMNPILYRGCYCDWETGFYYLNSRYYDPNTGRFINADVKTDPNSGILGYGFYTYCRNNPVMYADYSGCDAILLLDNFLTTHVGCIIEDANGKWWHFYWGALHKDVTVISGNVSVKCYMEECNFDPTSLNLKLINDNVTFGGKYDEVLLLEGDFSASIDEYKRMDKSTYNLYKKNCSHVTHNLLSKGNTYYKEALTESSKVLLPYKAFYKMKSSWHVNLKQQCIRGGGKNSAHVARY